MGNGQKLKNIFVLFLLISSAAWSATDELSLDSEIEAAGAGEAPLMLESEPAPSWQAPAPQENVQSFQSAPPSKIVEKNKGLESKRIPHPNAAKGLIRINKDGSYQYKIKTSEKSQSASMRFGSMTAPKIENTTQNLNFSSMYGSNPWTIMADYEWQPFRRFGTLGLQLGSGISIFNGKGRLVTQNLNLTSEERFTLFIVPVSAFIDYRFEYARKQWLVPYVLAGGTYYLLAEKRDDKSNFNFAAAPAVGGGGGIHFSVTRWDHQTAFNMDRDYGVSDMWVTLEARALQGLNDKLDFTAMTVSLGVTVDY